MRQLLIGIVLISQIACNTESDVSPGRANTFIKLFGGSNSDIAYKAIEDTTRGGFIILGTTEKPDSKFGVVLVKTDINGNTEWQKTYPDIDSNSESSLVGRSIIETSQGYLIVGESIQINEEQTETSLYLLSTDLNGNKSAEQSLSLPNINLHGEDIIQNDNGEYIVLSSLESETISNDIYLSIYDSDLMASTNCARQYSGGDVQLVKSLFQDENNEFVFGGTVKGADNDNSRVFRVPGDCRASLISGPLLKEGPSSNYTTHQVIPLESPSNDFALVGTTDENGNTDIFVARVDPNGVMKWIQVYDKEDLYPDQDVSQLDDKDEEGFTIANTTDRGFIIGGSTLTNTAGETDIIIIKTDAQGGVKWSQKYGDLNEECATYIQQTSDGGYMILGNTEFGGIDTIILIKTDAQGRIN